MSLTRIKKFWVFTLLFIFSFFSLMPEHVVNAEVLERKLNNLTSEFVSADNVIANEIIVKYKDKVKSFTDKNNTTIKLDKVKVNNKKELEDKIKSLEADPDVEFVQPNYRYKKADTEYKFKPSIDNVGQVASTEQWPIDDLKMSNSWLLSTGSGVTVAVIDSGIDINHEDLKGKVIGGKDFSGSFSYSDNEGHGTHLAGIIAADYYNNIGIKGLAYDSKLLSVKVLDENGEGDTYSVSQGITWAADNGAKILNMSLGTESNDPALKQAIDYAYSKGCVIVAATGNDGLKGVSYPAAYENVIAVGATNEANQLSSFSNFGPELDVVAPGVDILSTVPKDIFGTGYAYASGTSMSAAVVSAQIALVLAVNLQLKNSELMQLVTQNTIKLGAITPNEAYGNGIIDVYKILSGTGGALASKYPTMADNNTFLLAKEITNSTQFSDKLLISADNNWYKLKIPANKIVKLNFNTTEDVGLKANISKNDFYVSTVTMGISNQYVNEYYIFNYDEPKEYYVKMYNDDTVYNEWNVAIQYMDLSVGNTLPKDGTLRYSIDTPMQGKVVTDNSINISGWALSSAGINFVEAVIDGKAYELQYGGYRPDVHDVFSQYNNYYSGFNGNVDVSKLLYGKHTFSLRFTDGRGIVTETGVSTFSISNTLLYSIDAPVQGENVIGNKLNISGWALSKSSINKVQAVIDGVASDIQYGTYRPDVYNVFMGYNNFNSGFGGNIDISKLIYGNHTLSLRFTDGRGVVSETGIITFNIQNTLIYNIDVPVQGQLVTGNNLNISGWALSKEGINKVEAIVDGNTVEIQYGGNRPDVYNVFKEYKNENSGFSGNIDISKLSYGDHSLVLKFTDGTGRVNQSYTIPFKIPTTLRYSIDYPQFKQNITGNTLSLGGWALSKQGITKVEALIDGTVQEVTYGGSRPDVYSIFKDYNNLNSGFNADIDISKLPYGEHSLVLRFTDGKGIVTPSYTIPFKTVNTLIYSVDSPQFEQNITGATLDIWGWALSKAGINKVEAIIDGQAQQIQYGGSRPDVYNVFKEYNNTNSGFNGSVDISKLSFGKHSLKLQYTDKNGIATQTGIIIFYIPVSVIYTVDYPTTNTVATGNALNVSGWALSKLGIKKVEAIVDGSIQELSYGGYRPDVYSVFRDYNNKDAGFSGSIDVSKLTVGNHTLKIVYTDGLYRKIESGEIIFNKR